jgi:hypothetical protein
VCKRARGSSQPGSRLPVRQGVGGLVAGVQLAAVVGCSERPRMVESRTSSSKKFSIPRLLDEEQPVKCATAETPLSFAEGADFNEREANSWRVNRGVVVRTYYANRRDWPSYDFLL